jgi:hypothetical protein
MSENTVLIVSKEFLNRILVGLSEIQAKFAIPVIQEIEKQAAAADAGAKHWIESIESHLDGIKLKTTDKAPE